MEAEIARGAPWGWLLVAPDGRVQNANPAAATLYKATLETLVGSEVLQWLPEYGDMQEELAQGNSVWMSGKRHDGEALPLEVMGAHYSDLGALGPCVLYLIDLTKSNRSKQMATRRAARFGSVLSHMKDGVLVADASGRVAYANECLFQMFGFRQSNQVVGRALKDVLEAMREQCSPNDPAVTLDGASMSGVFHIEQPARRVIQWSKLTTAVERPETIFFLDDVTTSVDADRARSEFITHAAHELRTPLVSIRGYTELMQRREIPRAKQLDMLQVMLGSTQRLETIIDELLHLSTLTVDAPVDVKCEPMDLGLLVDEVIEGMRTYSYAASLSWTPPLRSCVINSDASLLGKAIWNIIDNACKYSPQGGEVQVMLEEWAGRRGAGFRIEVKDQGIGMQPEVLRRIFDKFYRADKSGSIPGTGLGLSFVKRYLDSLGCTIKVDSTPGEGTRVRVWLPVAQESEPAAKGPPGRP